MIKKITKVVYRDDEGVEYVFEPIEDSIELKKTPDGYELRYLTYDDNPVSPGSWSDDSLFLVHCHRDFYIKHDVITEDVLRQWYRAIYYTAPEGIEQEIEPDETKAFWVFPVQAYTHSGVSLSLESFRGKLPQGHFGFDVSHVGAVLAAKSEFAEEKNARDCAEGLIKEWNCYLSGDTYCLVCQKLDKSKKSIDYDVVGGYLDYDYALKALKTEI